MQKKILLIAVYITLTGVCVDAQNKKIIPPVPPTPPSAPTCQLAPVPPLPPEPPLPPTPPPPPAPSQENSNDVWVNTNAVVTFISPVIINSNGYEVRLEKIKDIPIVCLEKNTVKQRIRLSTWNAKRKYYEKKFGRLPETFALKQV